MKPGFFHFNLRQSVARSFNNRRRARWAAHSVRRQGPDAKLVFFS